MAKLPLTFFKAADLLDPEPLGPIEFLDLPKRPSRLRGRPLPKRG